jgi:hypothetical protein
MPLYVGWHLAIQVFPLGTTLESRLKPPGQDLIGRMGGHEPLSDPLDRHLL